MNDPYLYPHTDILKNLADVRDREVLSCMEAEYTSIRLAELVIGESASHFDFAALCDVHHYIFQDIYEWAGKIRIINIEKSEPALGGISIEYSDGFDINVNNLTQATTTYCIFIFNWHGVPCAFLHSRPLTQLKYCTNFSSKNQQIYY